MPNASDEPGDRRLRVGSLFSGYGGLDLAVEEVFDARTIWFSEINEPVARVFAHHWPDAPNLGDITTIDWNTETRGASEESSVHSGQVGQPSPDAVSPDRPAGRDDQDVRGQGELRPHERSGTDPFPQPRPPTIAPPGDVGRVEGRVSGTAVAACADERGHPENQVDQQRDEGQGAGDDRYRALCGAPEELPSLRTFAGVPARPTSATASAHGSRAGAPPLSGR